jgi:DNA polymerase-3 subunit delta'
MYRFDEIQGYENVISHFQSALKLNKVSHAYILEGETGMGKKLFANTFAKVLQCETHSDEACDVCQSCVLYNSNNHPDVIHIHATKKTGIGVDDIREQVNRDVHIKPYVFDYKVYIIHEADQMTIQAQNALLKTIEDPPSYVRFMLLASQNHTFLPTILSRCVVIKLKPQSQKVITTYLETVLGVPDYQAQLYSAFARGNIGRAINLKHSEAFQEMREEMIGVMENISKKQKVDVLDQVEVFEKYKEEKNDFLDLLLTWLRDLLVLKSVSDHHNLIHMDKKNQLLKQVPHVSYNRISMLIDGIERIQKYDRLHINYTLSVEVMLINAMNSK